VRSEDGSELKPRWVGLGKGNKRVYSSFSAEFRTYLESCQAWFDHLKSFRDSLAHRIPLYIPPYILTPEGMVGYNKLEQASEEALQRADLDEYDRLQSKQKEFGLFRPWMTHSLHERARTVVFHRQLLHDYLTIDECGQKMLEELDR
jgi:hypothetical protein